MKWLAIKLENLQSWENEFIRLNENGLTVLEARSETGKSVFIKAIKLGINYMEYRPDVRKSIVRNWWDWKSEKDNAVLSIILEDKSVVMFIFSPTELKTKYVNNEGKVKIYSGTAPKEIIEKLNLVQCKGSTRIINIIDNENKILFDTSEGDYNNNILDVFLKHPELENRRNNAVSSLSLVKGVLDKKARESANIQIQINQLPKPVNIDLANNLVNTTERLTKKLTTGEKVIYQLDIVNNLSNIKTIDKSKLLSSHVKLKKDKYFLYSVYSLSLVGKVNTIKNINEFTDSFSKLRKMSRVLKTLQDINSFDKPQVLSNTKIINTKMSTLKQDKNILNCLNNLLNIIGIKIYNVIETKSTSTQLKIIKSKSEIIENLFKLMSIYREIGNTKITNTDKLNIEKIKNNKNILNNIYDVLSVHKKIDEENELGTELNMVFSQFKETHRICPSCRQEILEMEL